MKFVNPVISTPTLNTERLLLNRFTFDDTADMFYGWANSEAATKYMFMTPCKTMEACRDSIQKATDLYALESTYNHWAIRLQSRCIGMTALFVDSRHHSARISYVIAPEFWGNGYTTEAVKAVLKYGFEALKLHRVEADHFAENTASGRVMRKAGMIQEGISREKYYKFGAYHDVVCYGILENEWKDIKK